MDQKSELRNLLQKTREVKNSPNVSRLTTEQNLDPADGDANEVDESNVEADAQADP